MRITISKKNLYKSRFYLYLFPTFFLLMVFNYYPSASAVYHSFFNWDGVNSIFIGFGNYIELINDEFFLASALNMLKLLIFGLIIGTIVPFSIAELVFSLRSMKAKYWWRVLFVAPMVVPGMVVLLLWQFIYDPQVGLLNAILHGIGLAKLQQGWLINMDIALYSLMFLGFPWVNGTAVLIYYAGLGGISSEVLDAARVDGVIGIRRIFLIDLPLIMGQVKLMIILGIIGGVQGFVGSLVLTNGGPAGATMVPALYLYRAAFTFGRMGFACAIGVMIFVALLVVTYINLKYIKSSTEHEGTS